MAQLIVDDGQLASIADTVLVSTTNATPVANAGMDTPRQAIGSIATLDGTGSSDADGHALSYTWAILSRPFGSAAVLDQPTSATRHSPSTLVATSSCSSSSATDLRRASRIRCWCAAIMLPVADAGADAIGSVGVLVALSSAGSHDDDGDPLGYPGRSLRPVGSAAFLSNPTAASPTFVPDVGGSYLARLVVHDGFNESAPDTVSVTVDAPRGVTMTPPASSVLTFDPAALTRLAGNAGAGWWTAGDVAQLG